MELSDKSRLLASPRAQPSNEAASSELLRRSGFGKQQAKSPPRKSVTSLRAVDTEALLPKRSDSSATEHRGRPSLKTHRFTSSLGDDSATELISLTPSAAIEPTGHTSHGPASPTTEYAASQHLQSPEEARLQSVAEISSGSSSPVSPALLRARQAAKPLAKPPAEDTHSLPLPHAGSMPTPSPSPSQAALEEEEKATSSLGGEHVSPWADSAVERNIMATCHQCSDFTCVGDFFHGCCYWCHMSPSASWVVHVTPTLGLHVRVVRVVGSAVDKDGNSLGV